MVNINVSPSGAPRWWPVDSHELATLPPWDFAVWGWCHQYLTDAGLIAVAAQEVAVRASVVDAVVDIASLFASEVSSLPLLVGKLGPMEIDDDAATRYWKLALLRVAWRLRESVVDPLELTAALWEEFDHDAEIASLVAWLPVSPGLDASRQGLLDRWQALVAEDL